MWFGFQQASTSDRGNRKYVIHHKLSIISRVSGHPIFCNSKIWGEWGDPTISGGHPRFGTQEQPVLGALTTSLMLPKEEPECLSFGHTVKTRGLQEENSLKLARGTATKLRLSAAASPSRDALMRTPLLNTVRKTTTHVSDSPAVRVWQMGNPPEPWTSQLSPVPGAPPPSPPLPYKAS